MQLALYKIGDDQADRWCALFMKSALSDHAVLEKNGFRRSSGRRYCHAVTLTELANVANG